MAATRAISPAMVSGVGAISAKPRTGCDHGREDGAADSGEYTVGDQRGGFRMIDADPPGGTHGALGEQGAADSGKCQHQSHGACWCVVERRQRIERAEQLR